MRMTVRWGGAVCWPACSVDHEHLHTGTGPGHGTGSSAWDGGRGALRPVSHPAGAGAAASTGQRAGSDVLVLGHGGIVPLVAGGVGRTDPSVRSLRAAAGRDPVLPFVQRLFAETGLPRRRCGHDFMPFGNFAHEYRDFPAEKNEIFCKKPLFLWLQMV